VIRKGSERSNDVIEKQESSDSKNKTHWTSTVVERSQIDLSSLKSAFHLRSICG